MEEVALANQSKVLTAFRRNQLSESHFAMSTGDGYDDLVVTLLSRFIQRFLIQKMPLFVHS